MAKNLLWKIQEALAAVIPITIIVLILSFTIAPMPFGTLGLFCVGAFMLILGMSFFALGADLAMMPIGEQMGAQITKSNKLWLGMLVCFLMGMMITVAEPDLQVLAGQVPSVPAFTLILTVAVGVGIFLVVALLRIRFQLRLSYMLIIFYAAVFIFASFTDADYLAVAFDSGGVTTGPITSPFILALGVGLSSVLGGKSSHDDSFGLLALCSIGPILAVMILGIFFDSSSAGYAAEVIPDPATFGEVIQLFVHNLPHYAKEVALALSPILLFFLIFQFAALKLPMAQLIKILIGLFYTYLGLVIFLTGVNTGFLPAGNYIGGQLASLSYGWIIIPIGAVMGFFIVAAEPAVHVLNDQVEDITGGAISKKVMMTCLSIAIAIAVGLAMARIMFSFSIWFLLIPGYGLALGLSLYVPKIFTAIAFDSGGVASGPMTATFLLPLAMGACEALGGNMLTDAFGIVAMVAMTPLFSVQIVGVVYKIKLRQTAEEEDDALAEADGDVSGVELPLWEQPLEPDTQEVSWLPGDPNTEWVENLEWAIEMQRIKAKEDLKKDNFYIELE